MKNSGHEIVTKRISCMPVRSPCVVYSDSVPRLAGSVPITSPSDKSIDSTFFSWQLQSRRWPMDSSATKTVPYADHTIFFRIVLLLFDATLPPLFQMHPRSALYALIKYLLFLP